MLMPFGKHKGTPIEELQEDYAQWLQEQDFCREPMRSELREHFGKPLVAPPATGMYPDAIKPYIRNIVLLGFKVGKERLANDPEKIKILQKARETLEDLLQL